MQNLCLGLVWLASTAAAVPSRSHLQPRAPSGAPVVSLQNGSYYGVHNSEYNQDFFLGIPFAHPPLNDLRFSNPVSLNSTWKGALPATDYAFVSDVQSRGAQTRSQDSWIAIGMYRIWSRPNRLPTIGRLSLPECCTALWI